MDIRFRDVYAAIRFLQKRRSAGVEAVTEWPGKADVERVRVTFEDGSRGYVYQPRSPGYTWSKIKPSDLRSIRKKNRPHPGEFIPLFDQGKSQDLTNAVLDVEKMFRHFLATQGAWKAKALVLQANLPMKHHPRYAEERARVLSHIRRHWRKGKKSSHKSKGYSDEKCAVKLREIKTAFEVLMLKNDYLREPLHAPIKNNFEKIKIRKKQELTEKNTADKGGRTLGKAQLLGLTCERVNISSNYHRQEMQP